MSMLFTHKSDHGAAREPVRTPVKNFFGNPSKGGRVKIFTLNRKDCQLLSDLGLV